MRRERGWLRCRRGSNPTSPPAGRRLWVPSSAVRLGYVHTAGAVASGRLAPGGWLTNWLVAWPGELDVERVRARSAGLEVGEVREIHLRVLSSTTTIGFWVRPADGR